MSQVQRHSQCVAVWCSCLISSGQLESHVSADRIGDWPVDTDASAVVGDDGFNVGGSLDAVASRQGVAGGALPC